MEGDPPWSEDAEVSALGAMLLDSEAAAEGVETLEVDAFYKEVHRRVFAAIQRVHATGRTVEPVAVCEELIDTGALEPGEAKATVAVLRSSVGTTANLPGHIEILLARKTQRAVLEIGTDLVERARAAPVTDAPRLVRVVQEKLRAARQGLPDVSGDLEDRTWDLADVMADPEGLRLPKELLSGIAVPEHFVLYCGDPKVGGKTSFLSYGAGAVATGGRFLGQRVRQGTVLWVMGEGSQVHIGRYLAQVGIAPPPETFVAIRSSTDPLGHLDRAVECHDPDLVVVDSLGSWTAPLDVDLHTPEVADPLKRVEAVARSGPAVVMIHWGRKADGDPAGHHTIKAIPDAIRMVEKGETERERVVKGHGRWHLPTIRYRMDEIGDHPDVPDLKRVRFRAMDPERDLEERILEFLEDHPGASKSATLDGVSGARREKKVEALQALVEEGIVERDTSGRSHRHFISENRHGHGTATVGHDGGHGGTGNGGVSVARGSPPLPYGEGGTSATVAEPVDDEHTPRRCACGNRIGTTATVCAACKKRRRQEREKLPNPDDVVQVGDDFPHSPRRTA